MPNEVFDDEGFRLKLANFFSSAADVDLDPPLPPPTHPESHDALSSTFLRRAGHPSTISHVVQGTAPLCDILRSGCTVDVPHITKHVRDEINEGWHRSSLWLLIRIAIQMSVDRCPGHAAYKRFLLYFMCTLVKDEGNASLSSDILHLMLSTILRRSSKLGSSTPDWLSEMAVKTCTRLQEVLDARWNGLNGRPYAFRNPSQDELIRDIQLSLPNSGEYIRQALETPVHESVHTPFHPEHNCRSTLQDFLSDGTFFDMECRAVRSVTIFDVERAVEQDIDDWLACVTNTDEACAQLETLMDSYGRNHATQDLGSLASSEEASIYFLTLLELYVAIDKLVVKEVPMLADYSPEIPIAFLERLLLRKTTSLHRLSRAYQYLFARHSRSRPGWSVLSNEFTEDSFPVRYYNESPHLQHLKACIEENAVALGESADLEHAHGGYQGCEQPHLAGKLLVETTEVSPLPAVPLHAKVVVFELQCPTYIRIWRSAVAHIFYGFHKDNFLKCASGEEEEHLLARFSALQPYLVERPGPPLYVQIHFAYFYFRSHPILRYVVQYPDNDDSHDSTTPNLSLWLSGSMEDLELTTNFDYELGEAPNHPNRLGRYVNSTSHTPNDIFAAQFECPTNLSLDEFIMFGHLRSGGPLQWLNILQGLRSKTLNLRRCEVHFALAHAAFQVGPLDLNTGTWVWHQELENSSFCIALLDELENLFVEVGGGCIDWVLMDTVSLLLTRVLASSPSKDVSEQAIKLLRGVRKTTFGWVQEILYDLVKAPTNSERRELLVHVSTTCRSTFDVDAATICNLFQSAEDVDALISCAFFTHNFYFAGCYSRPLHDRDYRLSLTIEGILRDAILADPSDYGIDVAAGRIFPCYKPGTQRWQQLQYPNTRWLTCLTAGQPSQTVHINLLDGKFRVDGQPLGDLRDKMHTSIRELARLFPFSLVRTCFILYHHIPNFLCSDNPLLYHLTCLEWISWSSLRRLGVR